MQYLPSASIRQEFDTSSKNNKVKDQLPQRPKNCVSPKRKYSEAQVLALRALRQYIFQEEREIPDNILPRCSYPPERRSSPQSQT